MRFMILVRATGRTEAGEMPSQALIDAMTGYHEDLARAGVLLDGAGLRPSNRGWRVRYDGTGRQMLDGPFPPNELVAGYTLIQARTRDEAMEWVRRFPNPGGEGQPAEIEVRELYEAEDFGLDDGDGSRRQDTDGS